MCNNCKEVFSLIKNFSKFDFIRNYQLYNEAIDELILLYEKGIIEMYAADLHFKDTMRALEHETKYTIQQYFYCVQCNQVFAIGACIRGTPYFRVIKNVKSKFSLQIFTKGIVGRIGVYYTNPRFLRSKFTFVFNGSMKELIKSIEEHELIFSKEERGEYHLFNYSTNSIALGIGRTGHSGGIFFKADLLEKNNQIIISGDIEEEKSYMPKLFKLEKVIFTICGILLFLPGFFVKSILKVLGIEETKRRRKQKLIKFFIKYINCSRI